MLKAVSFLCEVITTDLQADPGRTILKERIVKLSLADEFRGDSSSNC